MSINDVQYTWIYTLHESDFSNSNVGTEHINNTVYWENYPHLCDT